MGGALMTTPSEIKCARPAELNTVCSCLSCKSDSCFKKSNPSDGLCVQCRTRSQIPLGYKNSASTSNFGRFARSEINYEFERDLLIKINNLKLNKSSQSIKTKPKTLREYTDMTSGNPKSKMNNSLDNYILHLKTGKYSKSSQCCCEDVNVKNVITKGANENYNKKRPESKKYASQYSLKVCGKCKEELESILNIKLDTTREACDAEINKLDHISANTYMSIKNPEAKRKEKEFQILDLVKEKPTSEEPTTQKKRNIMDVRNMVMPTTLPSPTMKYNLSSASASETLKRDAGKGNDNSIPLTNSSNTLESKPIYSSIIDTIKKIKDYIPKKSIESNQCNCEPCQCAECKSYIAGKKNTNVEDVYYYCNIEYPYTPFNTKNKMYTQEKQMNYSCEPCECFQCPIEDSDKDCDYKSCESIECKVSKASFAKSKVVTPFLLHQHTACQCTPCECIICNPEHNYMPVNLKASSNDSKDKYLYKSGKYRVNTNSDKAAIPKLEKDSDTTVPIDLQTNTMIQDLYSLNKLNAHRMLALCAVLHANYEQSNDNEYPKIDGCEDCTNITHVFKENETELSVLSHDEKETPTPQKLPTKNLLTNNVFDRKPLENQVCTDNQYKMKSPQQIVRKPIKRIKNFVANECTEFYLDNLPYNNKIDYKCMLSYKRCIGDSFSRNSHPIKKGDVLTPSTHQTKIQKLLLAKGLSTSLTNEKACFDKCSNDCTENISKLDNNISMCERTSSLNKNNIHENKPDTGSELQDFYPKHIMKSDADMKDQENHKKKPSFKNNFTYRSSESHTSPTVSKSFCKGNPCVTYINNLYESSYNSSDNEPHNYLIRFPRSSPCVEKVLQGFLDHNLDLENVDICLEHKNLLSEEKARYMKTPISNVFDTKMIKSSLNLYKNNQIKVSRLYKRKPKFYKVFNLNNVVENVNANRNIESPRRSDILDSKTISVFNLKGSDISATKKGNNNQLLQNLKQVHGTSDHYCLSDDKFFKPTRKIDSWTSQKRQSFACPEQKVDSLNRDKEFEGVYKTLREAKEFSLHLLKLLAMYERANANFQKITDKLEISNEKFHKNKDILTPDVSQEQNRRDYHETFCNFDLDNKAESSLFTDKTIKEKTHFIEIKKEESCNSEYKTEKKIRDCSNNDKNPRLNYIKKEASNVRRNYDVVKRKKKYKKSLRKPTKYVIRTAKRIYSKKVIRNYSKVVDSEYSIKKVLSEGQISFKIPLTDYENVETIKLEQQFYSKQGTTNLSPSYSTGTLSTMLQIDKQDIATIDKITSNLKRESIKKMDKETSPKPIYVDKEVLCHGETNAIASKLKRESIKVDKETSPKPIYVDKELLYHGVTNAILK